MATGRQSSELTTDLILIRAMSRSERLALARTIMANQRTVLSYATTCLGLLATGYALLALTGHTLLQAAGVVALALCGVVGFSGYMRYRAMRKALGKITASHLLHVGHSLLHDEAGSASNSVP